MFNKEEKKFIIEKYPLMPTKEICDVLGYTERQVRGYAHSKGLRKDIKPNRFTKEQKEFIHKWYNVKSNSEISREIGLTVKQINDYGYKNIGLRDIEHYSVNEDYFKTIDTEEKAYWLGFLYADGCVHEDTTRGYVKSINMELGLAEIDKTHIHKLNKATDSNYPVKDKTVKLNGKEYKACRVTICNTNFCKNLMDKGCIPNKSLFLTFPDERILPYELINHFIRGYFDGDGCVSHSTKESKSPHYVAGFVGTFDVLSKIQEILNNEAGLNKIKISNKGNAFQTQWSGRNNCIKFYEYIYKGATVWLDRKHDKFLKIINYEV